MTSISLRNVSVEFPIYQGSNRSLKKSILTRVSAGGGIGRDKYNRVCVRALNDVSLDIEHGERVALIGANGSGKTTLLRVLGGIYEPSSGEIVVDGEVSPLFDVGLGLNPDVSGYDNIRLRGLYMGLDAEEIERRMDDIVSFSELGDYLSMPVRTYSAGMTLRLAFGVATCADPEILLMDEWLLAGDTNFLDKARRRMESFVERSNILVLASHAESIVREWCNKAVLMNQGHMEDYGSVDEIYAKYHRMT